MIYSLYRTLLLLGIVLLAPLALPACMMKRYWRQGLCQRLGLVLPRRPDVAAGGSVFWLHAASVGEVRAAARLHRALESLAPGQSYVVSCTSVRGRSLARQLLPPGTLCLLAPLDVPCIVRRCLQRMLPDYYVCLETELWPVMLHEARRQEIPCAVVNGRLSARSLARYRRFVPFWREVLRQINVLIAAGEDNAARFRTLGATPGQLRVAGNIKFDLPVDASACKRLLSFRERLRLEQGMRVVLCGSTHRGEEEHLLATFRALCREVAIPWLMVLAPRHLERLSAVRMLCERENMAYDLFSHLAEEPRRHDLVLLDTVGELADLYGMADYIFCGGSLVACGGHNPFEAARWGKPVFFGPHMEDFREVADQLESAGAGETVADATALACSILRFERDAAGYRAACDRALEVTRAQQGSAVQQAEHVLALRNTKELRS